MTRFLSILAIIWLANIWPSQGQVVVSNYYFNASQLPQGLSPQVAPYVPPPSIAAQWWSDRSGIKATLALTNFGDSGSCFIVPLSLVDIGRNELRLTAIGADLSVTLSTNIIYGHGIKISDAFGGTDVVYAVKRTLTDYSWTMVTNVNPWWGDFSPGHQVFRRTNGNRVAIFEAWSQDTLPSVIWTNMFADTNMPLPPMPP